MKHMLILNKNVELKSVQGFFLVKNGEIEFNINVWLKNAAQICPRMLETRLREFQISNVSGGACPWTPLERCVVPQLAMLAMQALFTSAAYSVQIRHLSHFLMTTLCQIFNIRQVVCDQIINHQVAVSILCGMKA